MKNKHMKWPKIKQFHNLVKDVHYVINNKDEKINTIVFRPKVKLHGTNAGIQIHSDGTVIPQGRNRLLSSEGKDQNGFAAWVKSHEKDFARMTINCCDSIHSTCILYGEWCGPGIQSKVAISKIPEKSFCIFAARLIGDDKDRICVEPNIISHIVKYNRPENLHVIPYLRNKYTPEYVGCNWQNNDQLQRSVDSMNEITSKVEDCDPFVKDVFGIEGVGEGLVWYPLIDNTEFDYYTQFLFKTKGDKHKVTSDEKAAKIHAEISPNAIHFVDKFVTENRLEQALQEVCEGNPSIETTGKFLKWVNNDIKEEGKDELNLSGLKWSDVSRPINKRSVGWFKKQCENLKRLKI